MLKQLTKRILCYDTLVNKHLIQFFFCDIMCESMLVLTQHFTHNLNSICPSHHWTFVCQQWAKYYAIPILAALHHWYGLLSSWPSGKLPFDCQKHAKNLTFFKKILSNGNFPEGQVETQWRTQTIFVFLKEENGICYWYNFIYIFDKLLKPSES